MLLKLLSKNTVPKMMKQTNKPKNSIFFLSGRSCFLLVSIEGEKKTKLKYNCR